MDSHELFEMVSSYKIEKIWENFRAGDKEAFAIIYNLHLDSMYSYGIKLTHEEEIVKDAIHEVFLDLYLKKEGNKTRPENLKYYLILALKRNIIKKLKKNRNLANDYICEVSGFEPEYSIETLIIGQEQEAEVNRQVQKVLSQLPAKQKEAIYLRFNQALEYDEVAQILNISIESARKQVYRALQKIRETFENKVIIFWAFLLKKNNSKNLSIFP